MIEYFGAVRSLHIAAVVASGSLFCMRGLAVQLGAGWAMRAPLRHASYAIDTVLLAAAIALSVMLHQYPFVHAWLTAKVLLLLVYIVLGSFALKRGRTRAVRGSCFVAAMATFAAIVSVALTHDPLGFLRVLAG